MSIKALIWDFEGVLLQTKYESAAKAIAACLDVPDAEIEQIFNGEFGTRVDKGEFSQNDLWDHMIKMLHLSHEKRAALEEIFNTDFYLDQELLEDIRQYRRQFKTGLLTNFSEALRPMLNKQWKIESAFDEIVISCEIGLVKPDPKIYTYMLDCLNCSAEEAIFIDDREMNVTGAEEVGLHAIRFTSRQDVLNMIHSTIDACDPSLFIAKRC
jgi:epoxide hydrolase-like predicted phosphatase